MTRASLALVFGTVAAFVATAVPPPIWYVPMDNVLALGAQPHGVIIDYYGRVLAVVAASLLGSFLGSVLGRFLPSSHSSSPTSSHSSSRSSSHSSSPASSRSRLPKLALAWAALAAALSIALSASMLWNRALHPITLPAPAATSVKP